MQSIKTDDLKERTLVIKQDLEEKVIESTLLVSAIFSTIIVVLIIIFLFVQAGTFFIEVSLFEFLFEDNWAPTYEPASYGAAAIILGTFLITIGAMVIAIPIGIGAAIFISELTPKRFRNYLKGAVEILAGIPSVVYGFFGLIVLNLYVREIFDLTSGATWFSGSIILAIMALPTIISVSEDAINSVPRKYREASLAMGSTKWQMIKKVVLPSAMSGITAGIILGMGRAIGETMAVVMVTGNAARIPAPIYNIFSPIRTITGTLAIEMGEVPSGSLHQYALFALAIILFLIVLVVNSVAIVILKRMNAKFNPEKQKKKIKTQETKKRSPFLSKMIEKKKIILYLTLLIILSILVLFWFGIFVTIIVLGIIGLIFIGIKKLSARVTQKIVFTLIISAMALVVFALGVIILYIVVNGIPAITIEFLTQSPRDLGRKGGIFPAILGTIFLVLGTIIFAIPLGIAAGTYLAEYTRDTRLTRIIRFGIDTLNGTPSIVFGLFGLIVFVRFFGLGISMLAGTLTLSLMILPTIIRTTEESLKKIPLSLREGSLALGSTKWQSISRVALPAAIPGIITGGILGMGRASGETAPILFTAATFRQRFLPIFPLAPVMALPYHLFIMATSVPGGEKNAAGTALVLLILVMILYVFAIYIRTRYQKKIKW